MANQRKTIPLNEAWFFFANSDQKTTFVNLQNSDPYLDLQSSKFLEGISKVAVMMLEIQSKKDKVNRLEKYMQGTLISRLAKRVLESYGYFIDENGRQKRRQIQSDSWPSAAIDWERGSATFGSIVLFGIRVLLPQPPKREGKKPKKGRPTREKEIYEALRICDDDPEFSQLVPKQRWSIIRDKIIENYPHLEGKNKGIGRSKILECDKIYFENKTK